MSFTRRKFLALVGGGTVVAAGAGFVATRTPTAALAPWERAGQYDDARLRALSYALLAPNPHNRQPWLAELSGADTVTIWRDPARDLPVTDPFARQLTIGMGCFLDLMTLAAAQEGFAVDTTLYPDGEDGPVAICRFIPDAATPDPLFAHVLNRRSHKSPFEDRAVTETSALAPYGDIYTDAPQVARLRALAAEAFLIEMHTPPALQESVDLLRIGKAEINAQPDGIALGGPYMETLAVTGLLTREAAADPENIGTKGVIDDNITMINGTRAFVMQTTPANTRADQIATGARWLRLNLAATGAGLALRPVSQALQEYPEMAELYAAIHAEFAPKGGTVQMLGLLGYADLSPRTPRWPLETRLKDA